MESRGWIRTGAAGALVLTAAIASCSQPESFHAGHANLATGMAGTGGAGAGAAGDGSGPAGASGLAGDPGGPAGTGGAGDPGNAAGMGGAGDTGNAAGMGGAGTGPAGTGPAGGGPAGMGDAGMGDAGMGGAGMGGAGMGGAGMGDAGTGAPPAAIPLPMIVSDHFRPTGGMGDGAVVGSVTFGTDSSACAGEPAAANAGTCYAVTYQPQPFAAGASSTWAGFFWQYPDNNWGGQQPQLVAAGAKAVSFYAKGMAGGEKITFKAGSIVNTPSVATPFSDAFSVETSVTLTTTWTRYSLPMTNVTYGGGVLGGFCWVTTATNATPIKFLLHGIVWEK